MSNIIDMQEFKQRRAKPCGADQLYHLAIQIGGEEMRTGKNNGEALSLFLQVERRSHELTDGMNYCSTLYAIAYQYMMMDDRESCYHYVQRTYQEMSKYPLFAWDEGLRDGLNILVQELQRTHQLALS